MILHLLSETAKSVQSESHIRQEEDNNCFELLCQLNHHGAVRWFKSQSVPKLNGCLASKFFWDTPLHSKMSLLHHLLSTSTAPSCLLFFLQSLHFFWTCPKVMCSKFVCFIWQPSHIHHDAQWKNGFKLLFKLPFAFSLIYMLDVISETCWTLRVLFQQFLKHCVVIVTHQPDVNVRFSRWNPKNCTVLS